MDFGKGIRCSFFRVFSIQDNLQVYHGSEPSPKRDWGGVGERLGSIPLTMPVVTFECHHWQSKEVPPVSELQQLHPKFFKHRHLDRFYSKAHLVVVSCWTYKKNTAKQCAMYKTSLSSYMGVSKNSWFSPQIIPCLIRLSIIFTIHFGGFSPLFLETPI